MHLPSVLWPILLSLGLVLLLYAAVLRRDLALVRWLGRARRGLPAQPVPGAPALLEGRAGSATLSGPLSGAACVFWQIEIWSKGEPGQRSTLGWYPLISQSSGAPLRVSTQAGALLIDPAQAELLLASHTDQQIGPFDEPSPAFRRVLQQFAVPLERDGAQRSLKIGERIIAPGQPLSVCGCVALADGETRLRAAPGQPLILADRDAQGLRRALRGRAASKLARLVVLVVLVWLAWLLLRLG